MGVFIFKGNQYVFGERGRTGPFDWDFNAEPNQPPAVRSLSFFPWSSFCPNGMDAALYSGSKLYIFKGAQYIRLTTWDMTVGSGQFASNGAGAQIDPGYPAPISNWGWGNFGKNGIDAALYSKSVCYFFKDNQYIRVHRGDEGPGTVDKGYPAPISNWKWGAFGANGIDAALNADNYAYFFKGNQYIRCTRNDDEGPGTVDPGYPAPITNWNFSYLPGSTNVAFGVNGINAALWDGTFDKTDSTPVHEM